MIEYSNLSEGIYKKTELSEEEIWMIFIKIFSSSESTKIASYKFGLIYSIIDNLENLTDDLKLNFDQLFLSFTAIYWKLVIRHKLYLKKLEKVEKFIMFKFSYIFS